MNAPSAIFQSGELRNAHDEVKALPRLFADNGGLRMMADAEHLWRGIGVTILLGSESFHSPVLMRRTNLRKSLPDGVAKLNPWQQIGATLALRAETRRGGRRGRAGKPCDKCRRDGTKAQCGREDVYRKIVDEQPMDRAIG
jgi:hypothetical protein